jgi:hypothetical protein
VLRITLPTDEDHPRFVLEGRLAGLWVKELIRVTRQLARGAASVFNIESVSYVDSLGEETLRWLNRQGATFIAENVYGKDLCSRLHLRRMAGAPVGLPGQPGQRARKVPSNTHLPSS